MSLKLIRHKLGPDVLTVDDAFRQVSRAIAQDRERYIRQRLRAMRTYRLNVVLEIHDSGWVQTSDGRYAFKEGLRLRMLLPRGPRPLP